MYIWILLATIMVALSFFNLSPRSDKGNAVNEIKATSLLNRFKIEHVAIYKTMECDAVLHVDSLQNPSTHTGGWTEGSDENSIVLDVSKTSGAKPDLGYIKFSDNLPIGYDLSTSPVAQNVKHTILCLSKPLEDPDTEYRNCFSTGYRYMISYMQIRRCKKRGKPLSRYLY